MRAVPLIGLLIAGFILFSSPAFALTIGCSSTAYGAGSGVADVVRLSASTNAHGQETTGAPGPAYPVFIRCELFDPPSFAIHLNTGTNMSGMSSVVDLFYLSANTNAHASLTGDATYAIPVQVGVNTGTLERRVADSALGETCATFGSDYIPVVRLSGPTNAHLQDPAYVTSPYDMEICLHYVGAGSPVDTGDIISVSQSGLAPLFTTADTQGMQIQTNNLKIGDPAYTNVTTMRVTAACDLANVTCNSIASYNAMQVQVFNYINGLPNVLIPGSVHATNHGSNYPAIVPALSSIPTTTAGALTTAVTMDNYTIGPGDVALPAGSYRIITIDFPSKYAFNGIPASEQPVYSGTNFALPVQDITITANGTGGTVAGGDVYRLRSIEFPNVFTNADIVANVVVTNEQPAAETNNARISVLIRDKDGGIVPPFDGTTAFPADFSTGNTISVPILIQDKDAPYLTIGNTYTIYATIEPYVDLDGIAPDNSEELITNNSAFRTFTSVDAPQSFSIPDSPWWMGIVMMGFMGIWLIAAARKKEN